MRSSISDFSLANPIYVGAEVAFYTVSGGVKTSTLATLYAGATGTEELANPQFLDSHGKFAAPVYPAEAVIATISGLSVEDHDSGIIVGSGSWNGDAAVEYLFDTATSMADPGTGDLRLNQATFAAATQIAMSALSSITGNPDLSSYIATWDDSTNTVRGTLLMRKLGSSAIAIFNITGVTDNGTWLQVAVTYVTSSGTFASGDQIFLGFSRAGDVAQAAADAAAAAASAAAAAISAATALAAQITASAAQVTASAAGISATASEGVAVASASAAGVSQTTASNAAVTATAAAASATASAAAAAADANSSSDNQAATESDLALTNADVVLTHADVVLTHADVATITALIGASGSDAIYNLGRRTTGSCSVDNGRRV